MSHHKSVIACVYSVKTTINPNLIPFTTSDGLTGLQQAVKYLIGQDFRPADVTNINWHSRDGGFAQVTPMA
jgi:hypothetical protein